MYSVDFLGHKVTKLIVGDNPFNGHSYITDYVTREEMLEYHTEDKILEAMHKMEELGVNTMLPLADPYIIRILQHYRSNGGKMNFIFQHYAPVRLDVSMRQMLSVDPIGAYISGSAVDWRWEEGNTKDVLADIKTLSALRESGVKVGFGTHHPEVIAQSEREGWDIDFYMACMYNFRRGREGQQSGFITGKSKSGIVVVPEDRPLMLNVLKDVKKPIIAFKIFAGGQMLVEKTPEERKVLIKDAYNTIFSTLKPNDIAVMGVFQKHHDQLTENISIFNEWEMEQAAK